MANLTKGEKIARQKGQENPGTYYPGFNDREEIARALGVRNWHAISLREEYYSPITAAYQRGSGVMAEDEPTPYEVAQAKSKKRRAYLDEMRRHERARGESQERSGADGFRSQWAHGIMAHVARLKAELVETDGLREFPGLFEVGGRRLKAKVIDGRYGKVWILEDSEEKIFGRKFIPVDDSHRDEPEHRSRVQAKLGLRQKFEWAPAGVSNTEASAYYYRADGGYPKDL